LLRMSGKLSDLTGKDELSAITQQNTAHIENCGEWRERLSLEEQSLETASENDPSLTQVPDLSEHLLGFIVFPPLGVVVGDATHTRDQRQQRSAVMGIEKMRGVATQDRR
jgi:hypothetical protein